MSGGAGGSPGQARGPGPGPQAVTAVRPAGGLAEEVDEKVLHAAFIPFGDITDIQIPLDYETGAWLGAGQGRARRPPPPMGAPPPPPVRSGPRGWAGGEPSRAVFPGGGDTRGGTRPPWERCGFAARDLASPSLQKSTGDSPSLNSSWQR